MGLPWIKRSSDSTHSGSSAADSYSGPDNDLETILRIMIQRTKDHENRIKPSFLARRKQSRQLKAALKIYNENIRTLQETLHSHIEKLHTEKDSLDITCQSHALGNMRNNFPNKSIAASNRIQWLFRDLTRTFKEIAQDMEGQSSVETVGTFTKDVKDLNDEVFGLFTAATIRRPMTPDSVMVSTPSE